MLSLTTFQPQLAIPPLTSLLNAVRSSSHGVAIGSRRKPQTTATITTRGEEPISPTEITDTLKSTLRDLGLDKLSSTVTVEELNPMLDRKVIPDDPNISLVSSATFFENKNGFGKEELKTKRSGRFHLQSFRVTLPHLSSALSSAQHGPLLYHQLSRAFQTDRTGSSKGFGGINNAADKSFMRDLMDKVNLMQTRKDKYAKKLSKAVDQEKDDEHKERVKLAFANGYAAADQQDPPDKVKVLLRFILLVGLMGSAYLLYTSAVGNGRLPGLRGDHFEINPEEIDVTFNDVVGMHEAKQELEDIVEYLRAPEKFKAMGAKLPAGVLLVGPPGMGKTLLARAVAGEASVPFFHASGSEFDEVFVGTGAKRVRQLFEAAKARAPCVIFIDEIDTVGAKRTNSQIHPYANQTINMLLSEMDGFKQNEGIIVLGATNRRNTLDQALLRPGRFDVEVRVFPPDVAGRKGILDHYLRNVVISDDLDTELVARGTAGCTGADLKNIVNQAALKAAIEGDPCVRMEHLEHAKDKILMGPAMKSRTMTQESLSNTAYHEAGHALVSWYTKGSNDLYKITIVPRGSSLGHTAFAAPKDPYTVTKAQLIAQMDVAMGGRIGEELLYGSDNVSSGASHDFQTATSIATAMVKQYGMSEKVGMRSFDSGQSQEFPYSKPDIEVSQATAEVIDEEIKRLLQESYDRAKTILKTHKSEHKALAEALLKYETLDIEDMKVITQGKSLQKKIVSPKARVNSVKGDQATPGKTPLMS